MKNAFNPEEETERDWDLELAEDVKTECEEKYGAVVDIYVVKESLEVRRRSSLNLFVLEDAGPCQLLELFS